MEHARGGLGVAGAGRVGGTREQKVAAIAKKSLKKIKQRRGAKPFLPTRRQGQGYFSFFVWLAKVINASKATTDLFLSLARTVA